MMGLVEDPLPALEVNAQHCGDPLARAYFSQAAREIRTLRSRLMQREADLHAARMDIRGLEGSIARLIVETIAEQEPQMLNHGTGSRC